MIKTFKKSVKKFTLHIDFDIDIDIGLGCLKICDPYFCASVCVYPFLGTYCSFAAGAHRCYTGLHKTDRDHDD